MIGSKASRLAATRYGGTVEELSQLSRRLGDFARAREWDQFHTPRNLAMALAGEVGELLAELQWATDEQVEAAMRSDSAFRQRVEAEFADVLNYLVRLADVMQVNLLEAAERKIDENEQRYPPELARGNARKYTEHHPDKGSAEA